LAADVGFAAGADVGLAAGADVVLVAGADAVPVAEAGAVPVVVVVAGAVPVVVAVAGAVPVAEAGAAVVLPTLGMFTPELIKHEAMHTPLVTVQLLRQEMSAGVTVWVDTTVEANSTESSEETT